jgi:hypothetical protein
MKVYMDKDEVEQVLTGMPSVVAKFRTTRSMIVRGEQFGIGCNFYNSGVSANLFRSSIGGKRIYEFTDAQLHGLRFVKYEVSL